MAGNNNNNKPSLDAGAALQPSCAAEPSFRVPYYGATGAAVPFKWESQPGTPKHHLSGDGSLPPLSPPPAYFSGAGVASPTKPPKKSRRLTLQQLVRRRSSSPGHVSCSYSSSSSSSNGETASYYSPESKKASVRSVLTCFGLTALVNGGCGYPVSSVKSALFSAVACRGRSTHAVDYVV